MDIDLNVLISKINTNNDIKITKQEIKAYEEQNSIPSIFANYFNSISNEVSVTDCSKELQKIMIESENSQTETSDNKFQNIKDKVQFFEEEPVSCPIKTVNSLEDIPQGSHENIRDARGCDISNLTLTKEELLNLTIDNSTVLSDEQKSIIDEYAKKMKDPGLGIRALHARGYTGKGIKMAIIDQPLTKHKEYASNVKEHYDVNASEMGWNPSIHGAAVTSIAVGKTVGVAPDADLAYYSAVNFSEDPKDIETYKNNIKKEIEQNKDNKGYVEYLTRQLESINSDFGVPSNAPYVDAINQILDNNEKLPENKRIPVISISWGFNHFAPGYEDLQHAIQRAKDQGVFIVSTALMEHYGMNTCGANRNPQFDPNDSNSYEAGAFWKQSSESASKEEKDNLLLVPMDHRTVADFQDTSSYRYEGNDGGMSWSTPWLASLYVLAKQADTNITPQKFWDIALETSNECRNNDSGEYVGRIVNPEKLIDEIKARLNFTE